MHDDVGLLVEDDEVLILEEDVERDVLGRGFLGRWGRDEDLDDIAEAEDRRGLGAAGVDGDATLFDEPLELGPAHEADAVGEVLVEALLDVALKREDDPIWCVVVEGWQGTPTT